MTENTTPTDEQTTATPAVDQAPVAQTKVTETAIAPEATAAAAPQEEVKDESQPVPAVTAAEPVGQAPVATTPVENTATKVTAQPPTVTETVKSSLNDFDATVAVLKQKGTQAEKILISGLETYMANMAPGIAVTIDEGARYQRALWRIIFNVAENAPYDEFKRLWDILLAFFDNFKDTVFNERYVYRFANNWQGSHVEYNGFTRTVNLILVTIASGARGLQAKQAVSKQVDIVRTLSEGYTQEGRKRITGYYGL